MVEVIKEGQTTIKQQQVDRGRRYWFISRLTAFCLVTSGIMVAVSGLGFIAATALLELYVQGLLSLATVAVGAYVTGSVIDYNGGVGNMLRRTPEPAGRLPDEDIGWDAKG